MNNSNRPPDVFQRAIFLFSHRHQLPPHFVNRFENQGRAGFAGFLLATDVLHH